MTDTTGDAEHTPPDTDTGTGTPTARTPISWTISDDDDHYCCLAY
ncbi:hypothetical protein ACWIGI_34555 [Nocardia sp. NPDC055321]